MKNKIFSIILSIVLSLPITVWAVDNYIEDQQLEQPDRLENLLDDDLEQIKTNELSNVDYKQPVDRRKIFKKFIAAMGGVAISSFTIFAMLTVYNRVRERFLNSTKIADGETSLETPEDLNEALKTFLDKTDWS